MPLMRSTLLLPSSANTADQNFCVPDAEAVTDAEAAAKPSATPDAATSPLSTHLPLLLPQPATADEDARTAAHVAVTTDLLQRLMASTTGPSAPSRSPNKARERNQ
ncbi:hypothetical protein AAVH_20075 [Aphelenchoides avenae]|nr:hypothetical protein AAVH_20075 [Aphelenchus avenae]